MKTIFLFPGYGAQFVGMGKELYDEFRIVQEYFEEASNCIGHNFVKLCFAASDVELGRMDQAYPSLFLVSCAIAHLLKDQEIYPDCVAGYNIGEYAAIYTAKGFTFPDGLYLISKYVSFYQQAFQQGAVSGLRISGLSLKMVKGLCELASDDVHAVYVAASLSPQVHVVMGHADAVDRVRKAAGEKDAESMQEVGAEFGLHSSLMEQVVAQYKIYMEKVDFKDLEVPLLANVDAKPITLGADVKETVINQTILPIQWHKILAAVQEYDLVVQVGPGTEIRDMVLALYPDKKVVAVNTKADIQELKQIINQPMDQQKGIDDANI
ncbi:MAG TPA: acyltransferase domain-containing protein [Candidatus Babeliales bacterium]|nr:acyltransferase domain-containing protein [Candidatus Babeliales bacterium]